MNGAGLTIFSRLYTQDINKELFGMLVTALNAIAESTSEGQLKYFELSEKRYTILKKYKFLFAVNSSNEHKQKKIDQELSNMAEKFFKIYPEEDLNNFKGNLGAFSEYEKKFFEEIHEKLEQPVKEFWNGIVHR